MLETPGMPTCPPLPSHRHLREISQLQSQQKQEVEALYRRLGKPLPPDLGLFRTAPPAGCRRKSSRSKLKAGKLLTPLVQQLKAVASSTGWLAPSWRGGWGRGRACRGRHPALEEASGNCLHWRGSRQVWKARASAQREGW